MSSKKNKLAKEDSATIGLEADSVKEHADTFRHVLHPDPASRGTNFAWVQHFIHHLTPQGIAVPPRGMANGLAPAGYSIQTGDCNARSALSGHGTRTNFHLN